MTTHMNDKAILFVCKRKLHIHRLTRYQSTFECAVRAGMEKMESTIVSHVCRYVNGVSL
jgi:hypothetical protein